MFSTYQDPTFHITLEQAQQPTNGQSRLPRTRNRVAVIESARAALAWAMGIDYPMAEVKDLGMWGTWGMYTSQEVDTAKHVPFDSPRQWIDCSPYVEWAPGYQFPLVFLNESEEDILRELIPALASNVVYTMANPGRLPPDWCFDDDKAYFLENAQPIAESWGCSVEALHFACGVFACFLWGGLLKHIKFLWRELGPQNREMRDDSYICYRYELEEGRVPRYKRPLRERDNEDYRLTFYPGPVPQAPDNWLDSIKDRAPICEAALLRYAGKKEEADKLLNQLKKSKEHES